MISSQLNSGHKTPALLHGSQSHHSRNTLRMLQHVRTTPSQRVVISSRRRSIGSTAPGAARSTVRRAALASHSPAGPRRSTPSLAHPTSYSTSRILEHLTCLLNLVLHHWHSRTDPLGHEPLKVGLFFPQRLHYPLRERETFIAVRRVQGDVLFERRHAIFASVLRAIRIANPIIRRGICWV